MEVVLTIAGSDPSGGAGIQQDLKTITAMGCYGATVITALTSQNTMGVSDVMAVPGRVVSSQLQAVLDDLDVRAVKIGMIPNQEVSEAVVETLRPYLLRSLSQNTTLARHIPVVYDPVMVSTSGRRLMDEECLEYIRHHLFPLCSLVTPNLPETVVLTGKSLDTEMDIDEAGHQLVDSYHASFLLKGGHGGGELLTDRLYQRGLPRQIFLTPRVATTNLHGTGCTLSSAIAASLAKGRKMEEAVEKGKQFVDQAIRRSIHHGIGHGNGPLLTQ